MLERYAMSDEISLPGELVGTKLGRSAMRASGSVGLFSLLSSACFQQHSAIAISQAMRGMLPCFQVLHRGTTHISTRSGDGRSLASLFSMFHSIFPVSNILCAPSSVKGRAGSNYFSS